MDAAIFIDADRQPLSGEHRYELTFETPPPVDAFWSVTVYNADGYLEANDLGVNSYNNHSAVANPDGSITIHFGGDPDGVNYLPISAGWNYGIRMYEPDQSILDGSWVFPRIVPVE